MLLLKHLYSGLPAPLAWAFLQLVAADGSANTERQVRLQLYTVQNLPPSADPQIPSVLFQYTFRDREQYPATLYITIKGANLLLSFPLFCVVVSLLLRTCVVSASHSPAIPIYLSLLLFLSVFLSLCVSVCGKPVPRASIVVPRHVRPMTPYDREEGAVAWDALQVL